MAIRAGGGGFIEWWVLCQLRAIEVYRACRSDLLGDLSGEVVKVARRE